MEASRAPESHPRMHVVLKWLRIHRRGQRTQTPAYMYDVCMNTQQCQYTCSQTRHPEFEPSVLNNNNSNSIYVNDYGLCAIMLRSKTARSRRVEGICHRIHGKSNSDYFALVETLEYVRRVYLLSDLAVFLSKKQQGKLKHTRESLDKAFPFCALIFPISILRGVRIDFYSLLER